jgi:ABC-2 type transport system permease protein
MSAVNIAEELNIAAPERAAATATHATHPFLWSIRRELWESRSILGAPLAVACILVLATLVAAVRFTGPVLLKLGQQNLAPSSLAAALLLPVPIFLGITMVLVAALYSLDALLSERRDRSILFWKSLPVSDTVTVLSKMAVPIIILPAVTFTVTIATDIVFFVIETIALLAHHASVGSAWVGISVLSQLGLTAYSLVVVTLWYAPIYVWCLLVSAWARRAPLVWAVIPFFLLAFFEKIASHTHHVRNFISNRFAGVFLVAFSNRHGLFNDENSHVALTPRHFLATPALWGGLLFAALALILIIRLRRSSDPI